ncbi:outer envelope pore protein 16-2, chloroplastic-like isoform X2 [Mangifera indica]|uniref:outer envelope pore protein 16-2, chloroplastic-like isoform X2 n=1 Tax=Mangifera indica TaxID=29780 RepID=UPI001CFA2520|nr:outer envelope pore protein 16-2, chloroplastic-like isoform X2 [Mangifera indica]
MSNLESRSLLDEFRGFDKGGFFDLGHPLLNRIAESFLKAAGIGAVQAVSREAYFTAVEGSGLDLSNMSEFSGTKKHNFSNIKGETNRKSIEAMVKNIGKESLQWGMAAGVYSGLTYGLKEARGAHDWWGEVFSKETGTRIREFFNLPRY